MSKSQVMNNLTRTFNKGVFTVKKYSPEILLGVGLVTGVTSAVMLCKASTKASAVMATAKEKIDTINEVASTPEFADQYTEEDKKRDLAITYVQTGLDFAKLYGPAVLMGTVSIGCILASHGIMHKRNVALGAAYTAASATLKEYKERVRERLGDAVEKELTYNIKAKEVEEVIANEDGTETTLTKTVEVAEGPILSEYAMCFDETCLGWSRNADDNKFFLLQQQNWCNERLKSRGMLTLNEMRESIGLPKTQLGQMVGWVYGGGGDDFVDFGIFNIRNAENRAFVNGLEKSVWLDPNVDGYIYDLMK